MPHPDHTARITALHAHTAAPEEPEEAPLERALARVTWVSDMMARLKDAQSRTDAAWTARLRDLPDDLTEAEEAALPDPPARTSRTRRPPRRDRGGEGQGPLAAAPLLGPVAPSGRPPTRNASPDFGESRERPAGLRERRERQDRRHAIYSRDGPLCECNLCTKYNLWRGFSVSPRPRSPCSSPIIRPHTFTYSGARAQRRCGSTRSR